MTVIPVVTVESSNPSNNMNRFFASLRLIGSVLRTSAEVEELIEYVGSQLDDLAYRSQSDTSLDRPNVYVGGIPSKGIKALSSTDPDYAAFKFIKAVNVAAEYEAPSVSYVGRNVRLQQLIDLNPDVVFIDASGIPRVLDDLRRRSSLVKTMNAYRQKKIYVVWPDYSRHFNFEIMLINAWYAGTILYPDRFSDIDVMAKADEILAKFVGKPIARDLAEVWGPFRNLLD